MSQQDEKNIKVLLAQFPLETHSRGMFTVAHMLRDAGMEIVLLGNATPQQIISAAADEDVDVVGISNYCGGHLLLGGDIINEAKQKGIKERTAFLMGGVLPPADMPRLKELGFDAIFEPGATQEEISSCIRELTKAKG